jgi:hypothetical protein
VHFHTPFHPFRQHPWAHAADAMNLVLILLGMLAALLLGPIHLD